jgi:hypothetical protein
VVAVSLALAFLLDQPQTGRLHGRVLDPSGAVLTGTRVVATSTTGQRVEARTNRQGVYAIERLPAGDYMIVVVASGFDDAHQTVTIAAGADVALDITLRIAVQHDEVMVEGQRDIRPTDPAANASTTIIKGRNLEALSDDPDELEAQLHALAGPTAGGGGGQIYIDGFSGGKLPPKSAIQEIRVNQNPYSAEFDALGAGRIEIITKPGSQTTHGRLLLDGNDRTLNARNPFLFEKPDHHYALFGGTVSGPLWTAASFAIAGQMENRREISVVHAVTLDPSLNVMSVNQAAETPRSLIQLNPRVDLQAGRDQTVSIRYRFDNDIEHGNGVGQLSLPTQAFDVRRTEHDFQFADLKILNQALLNDMRFEYRRFSIGQTTESGAPQVSVLGAFTGGGNNLGNSRTAQNHIELHDYVSVAFGAQTLRAGGRLRTTSTSDSSMQNFNGTFTFSSLDGFQITERGLRQGWTPAHIRAAGGGASQFSVVAGQPALSDTLIDVGLFAQDDWRVGSNVTISGGIRYETQSDIRIRADFAPRVGVAWSLGPSIKGGGPAWVVRSGLGIFYERFLQSLVLQAERLDGTHTTQFIVASPDFFPWVPSRAALTSAQLTPTVYRVDQALQTPTTTQTGITIERKLGRPSTIAVGYLYSHGANQLLSRNVNAPASGEQPQRPPLYQFESEGIFKQHQLTAHFNLRPTSWVSFSGYYVLSSARANTSGAGSFPSNPFNLSADDGRATFDARHRLVMFAGLDLPGFRIVPFVTATSGQPFDITVGRDLNGDSIFNDRPAFATDGSRPSVILTRFGAFDTAPLIGQTIIPHNFGAGPAQVSVNLRVMKPFVVHQHDTVRIDAVVSNLFNHVNAGLPVGNLSSPFFGQSIGLSNTLSGSANRQVHLQLQFLF